MAAQRKRGKGSGAGQREEQQKLIGQVLAHRHARIQVMLHLPHGPARHLLGGHSPLAETDEDLGQRIALH